MILPTFQAQNPAKSGYALGWSSCTAFSGAMAASYDRQVLELCTGGQVRQRTGDVTGGLNLTQVDLALNEGWQVNLDTRYRMPWADFAKAIEGGRGAVLQGSYVPIADSRFDAGRGFRGNHAVFVGPDWVTMDPLADGRYGVYQYHGEVYPSSLLRAFAGRLDFGGSSLGDGLVYASLTAAHKDGVAPSRYMVNVRPLPGQTIRKFVLWDVSGNVITHAAMKRTGPNGFSATSSAPRLYRWPGHASQSLVKVTSGFLAGRYLRSYFAREV